MKFPISEHATKLLSGLKGLEVGGAAHNPFDLDTVNADIRLDLPYHDEQMRLCGEVMPIDVQLTYGEPYPFNDGTWDFVISSHVIEHHWNPVGIIHEWLRITKPGGYVYIICPQPWALESDRDKPLSGLAELAWRNSEHGRACEPEWTDEHHHRWTSASFRKMCQGEGMHVWAVLDPDDKVGNGFTVVIKKARAL